MALSIRTILIDAAAIDSRFAQGVRFKFYPTRTEAASGEILLIAPAMVRTDALTIATVNLPVKATGTIQYTCEIGFDSKFGKFDFYLNAGAPISLSELFTGGTPPTTTENEYIDIRIALLDATNPAKIVQNAAHRFTSDAEKQAWNAKQNLILSTNGLSEGSTNLYFLASRVLSAILTGISFASNAAITATDSVLSALGKLQAQISGKAGLATANTFTANQTVAGTAGGSSFGSRSTATTIKAGTSLYDVGLRINTNDNTNTADPNYPYGSYSALDIDLRSTNFSGGDALRIFTNQGGVRSKVAYFGAGGEFYTRVGIVISGSFANSLVNQGEDTTITPPSNDLTMLGIWQDVPGGIQVRAGNVANPWVWEGLDRNANRTSSILEDGSYWFGAGATRAGMDAGIKRVSAGVLEINSTTAGDYRDLKLRSLIASGNVGIGTTAPGERLHVNGNILIPIGNAMRFGSDAIQIYGSVGNEIIFGGSKYTFQGGGHASFAGNVGIGVLAPAAKLDVVDTVLAGSAALAGSAVNVAQTWNTTGTPTAFKLNITDTASNANSNLIDLQVGGVSKFKVKKDGGLEAGTLFLNDGTVKQVTYGAVDSAGVGFKIMRIPN